MGLRSNAAIIAAGQTAAQTASLPVLLRNLLVEQKRTNELLEALIINTGRPVPPRS